MAKKDTTNQDDSTTKSTVKKIVRKVSPKKKVEDNSQETIDDDSTLDSSEMNQESEIIGKRSFFRKIKDFVIKTQNGYLLSILLALVAIGIFIFYQYRMISQSNEFKANLHALSEKNKKMMEEQNKNFLHQIAAPFTWAVRSEMLRKNYEIVDQYMIKLVQKQNFQSVFIVDKDGKVILSSDKKNQGKKFSDFMPSEYLSYSNVVVKKITDTKYYCSSPILGFESRIGTVFFEYHPRIIDLDKLYEKIETTDKKEKVEIQPQPENRSEKGDSLN